MLQHVVKFINTLRLLEIPKALLDWPRAKGGNGWMTGMLRNVGFQRMLADPLPLRKSC